jgi:hypothetical protein
MLGCARKDDSVEGTSRVQHLGLVIIDGEQTGILKSHVYGLLNVFEITSKKNGIEHKILRIRNPWGKSECIREWSGQSEEIKEHREEIQEYIDKLEFDERFEIDAEDGTFLIDYVNWASIYNKLYVAIDFSEQWSGRRFTDNWTKEISGGLPLPVSQRI